MRRLLGTSEATASVSNTRSLLHELLFALNLGFALRLGLARITFSDSQSHLQWRINSFFHLNPHQDLGAYAAFFVFAFWNAIVVFLLVRLLFLSSVLRRLWDRASGLASLLAMPLIVLYVRSVTPLLPGFPRIPTRFLAFELLAAVLCGVLYLSGSWPFPGWSIVGLLGLHFVFWTWICFAGLRFWLYLPSAVFPALGFLACLAWGIGLNQKRSLKPQSRSNA